MCSPNSSCDNDLEQRDTISYICNKFKGHKLIVGDFSYGNIDWKCWAGGNEEANFLSCSRNNLLLQHVTEPTRFRASDEPHILDLILSDEKFISNLEYLCPVGKRDRVVLSFDCEIGITSCNNSHKFNFYSARNARIASAVLATAIPSVCLSVRLSVCPSVRPSHAGIVSKRRHVARCSLQNVSSFVKTKKIFPMDDPFLLKLWLQVTYPLLKAASFDTFCLVAPQP